jgi:hypothetical protein
MIKYLQLPFYFDLPKMQQEVIELGNTNWKMHFQVKHYNGEWSAIPLRSIGGDANNNFISPVEGAAQYSNTIFLEKCNYLNEVLQHFKCPLLSVRLLKLTAGTQVHTHKDAGLCYEDGLARIHVPIFTNNQIDFIVDNEQLTLLEGECWYMNFNLPHSVHNKSTEDRIHLVIDAEVNQWMKDLFALPTISNKKELADAPIHTPEEQKEIIAALRLLNTEVANRLANDMEKNIL